MKYCNDKKLSQCEQSFLIIPRLFVYKFYLLLSLLILEDEVVYFNDIGAIQKILHDNPNYKNSLFVVIS